MAKTKGDRAALIAALARGATLGDAGAAGGGLSISTVQRRLREADFKREVVEAQSELTRMAVGALLAQRPAALRRLEELLNSDNHVDVRWAVSVILHEGHRYQALYNHEVRLADLEQGVDPTGLPPNEDS
jgi:hypothetical protein